MDRKMGLIFLMVLGVACSHPQAVSVGKGGVSADFAGYHASAGLGGLAGGGGAAGGLFARARLPDGTGAAAGLGGEAAGGASGGAFAGAGVAGGPSAGAGLGGVAGAGTDGGVVKTSGVQLTKTKTKAVSGASFGGSVHVEQKPSSFFDDIFNIPTSVLKAVNQMLNNKAAAGGVGARKSVRANLRFRANGAARGGSTGVVSGASSGASSGSVAGSSSGSVAGSSSGSASGSSSASSSEASSGSGASASSGTKLDADFHLDARSGCGGPDGCVVVKQKPVVSSVSASGQAAGDVGVNKNYDAVFNIPITALKSVNQFLNNLG